MLDATITDEAAAYAVEICKKYNRIKDAGRKAEEAWRYNLQKAETAKYPREREMYEERSETALAGFKASDDWIKSVDALLWSVEPFLAQCVVRQHFIDGLPLKAIKGKNGKYMSRTTATKYKKLGIQELAEKLMEARTILEAKEEILKKSL